MINISLARIIPILEIQSSFKILTIYSVNYGSDSEKNNRPMVVNSDINCNSSVESTDLEEPTTCCMSGCPNCVWIQYAEKLSQRFNNSSDDVQKIIMEKITDPNMKAFLSMELRCRNLIK